jgi:hypothetical protein
VLIVRPSESGSNPRGAEGGGEMLVFLAGPHLAR